MPASARGILPRILRRFGQLSVCFCACSGAGFPRSVKIPHLSCAASPEPPPPSGLLGPQTYPPLGSSGELKHSTGNQNGTLGPATLGTGVGCKSHLNMGHLSLACLSSRIRPRYFVTALPPIFLLSPPTPSCKSSTWHQPTPNTKRPFFLSTETHPVILCWPSQPS